MAAGARTTEERMPAEPFRFVHAADLHLEQPIYGLAEAPV